MEPRRCWVGNRADTVRSAEKFGGGDPCRVAARDRAGFDREFAKSAAGTHVLNTGKIESVRNAQGGKC
jgi:hypothetical protein